MASPRSAQTRKARTDEKVFRATVELLRAAGTDAVTVEAVAARSGVAKTTIYRRHADRTAMLKAALDHYLPWLDRFEGDDPRRVLIAIVAAMSTTVEDYVGLSMASTFTARNDQASAIVRDGVLQPRLDLMATRLRDWTTAGLLRADLDVELTVSTLIGTIVVTYGRDGAFPPRWPERLVEHMWPLLAPVAGPPSPQGPPHLAA